MRNRLNLPEAGVWLYILFAAGYDSKKGSLLGTEDTCHEGVE